MASPNTLKRNFHEVEIHSPLIHQSDRLETHGIVSPTPENWNQTSAQISSAEISTDKPSAHDGSSFADGVRVLHPTPSALPAKTSNKRKKLTHAEQEAKQMEKAAKDRQKAEEKEFKDRQRAEEKGKLEESRRAKEAEKEERRKAKEARTRMKEEERQKKEEEKNKKEKSQLRLNRFLVKPFPVNAGCDDKLTHKTQSATSSRRSSVASINEGNISQNSRSITSSPSKNQQSDFQRAFPSFFLQSHTILAPQSCFTRDEKSLLFAQTKIDEGLGSDSDDVKVKNIPFDLHKLLDVPSYKRIGPQKQQCSVKGIVERIHGTYRSPKDLMITRSNNMLHNPIDGLKRIPMKYLRFAEDVRPPYIGTYTKIAEPAASNLRRNPFRRGMPATDYDYDSEAEWEEPGEGEDLDSEAEDEIGDDEEGDEMEGFLDDEEAAEGIRGVNIKNRPLISDLEPTSTGLCWELPTIQAVSNNLHNPHPWDLKPFRLDIISDQFQIPIDPYSTNYWQSDIFQQPEVPPTLLNNPTNPLRLPLNVVNRSNNLLPKALAAPVVSKAHVSNGCMMAPTVPLRAPKRLVAAESMESFKAAIQGSDLTKAGLVEVLKKQFPKQSKDAIKDTIGLVAERIGAKEAEKRWVVKESYLTPSAAL